MSWPDIDWLDTDVEMCEKIKKMASLPGYRNIAILKCRSGAVV
jgi:hypothetical protein